MTILVSDLGETVINKFKNGTFKLADFTVLPQKGVWRQFLDDHPWMLHWLEQRKQRKAAKRRLEEGFQPGPDPDFMELPPTIEQLAVDTPSGEDLARRLAKKVRETANDLKTGHSKRYSYEEWVEFTQLIRFTASKDGSEDTVVEEDLIEWDWIGEDSPMISKQSEPEFVLDRLCESMQRYIRRPAAFAGGKSPNSRSDQRSRDEETVIAHGPDGEEYTRKSSDDIDPLDTGKKVFSVSPAGQDVVSGDLDHEREPVSNG